MNSRLTRFFLPTIALLCVAVPQCFAYSTYTYNVGSTISSLTVSAGTHGFSNVNLAPFVLKASGARALEGEFSFSVNPTTYAATFSFSPALTSGAKVAIMGAFNGGNTSASTDFQVTGTANGLTVCSACSTSAYAQRSYNSHTYVQSTPVTFEWDYAPAQSTDVRVYLYDNRIVFGVSSQNSSVSCAGSSASCRVDVGVTDFPYASVPLAHTSWSGASWDAIVDDRPLALQ